MASTLKSHAPAAQAGKYVDFDEFIDYQLEKTRAGIRLTDVLTASVGVSALALGYLLVFVVCDHWLIPGGFPQWARALMLGGVVVASIAWVALKVVVPYMRRVNALYAARVIESSDPGLKSTLLNLVDLKRAGRPVPAEIRGALEKRAAVSLSNINVDHAVDRRILVRLSYALLIVVLLCCLYSVFSPKKISSSIWRAIAPTTDAAVSTQIEIVEVEPGDVRILARTKLAVSAVLRYRGESPERVTLYYTTDDRRYVDEPIEMRVDDETVRGYRAIVSGENGGGIRQNLTYRIEAGDAGTRDFQVEVIQPPSARVNRVEYEYPRYTELPPRTQHDDGHINALEGTKVTVHATANMPVKSAVLMFADDEQAEGRAEERPMQITDGTKLSVTLTREIGFRSDGTYPRFYRIQVTNDDGENDPEPTLYNVRIIPDKPPSVSLLDPVRDLEVPANAVVPLLIEARDPDFRLKYLTLRMEKDGEQLLKSEPIYEGTRSEIRTTFDWKIESLSLKPGDRLTYWIEARDNKTPEGNRSLSQRLNLTIKKPVDKNEVQKQLAADKKVQQEKLDELEQDRNDSQPERRQQEETDDRRDQEPNPDEPPPGNEDRDESDPEKAANREKAGNNDANQKPGDPQQDRSNGGETQNQEGDGAGNTESAEDGADGGPNSANGTQKKPGSGEKSDGKPAGNDGDPRSSESTEGNPDGAPAESAKPENGTNPANADREPGNSAENRGAADEKSQRLNPDDPEDFEDALREFVNRNQERRENPEDSANDNLNDKSNRAADASAKDSKPGDAGTKEQNGDASTSPTNRKSGQPGTDPAAPNTDAEPDAANPDVAKPDPLDAAKDAAGDNASASKTPKPKQGDDPAAVKPDKAGGESGPDGMSDAPGENTAGPEKGDADGNPPADKTPAKDPQADGGKDAKPSDGMGDAPDKPIDGTERPADSSADAKRRRATGDEKGPATPDREPNADPVAAKNKLDRDPGDKPEKRTRPGEDENTDPSANKPGTNNPTHAEPVPKRTESDSPAQGDRTSEPPGDGQTKKKAGKDAQSDPGNPELTGRGRKDGQVSEQPDGGEDGSGRQADQGSKGSRQTGAGDTSTRPGSNDPADKPNGGKPSGMKGDGSSKTAGDSKPGGPGDAADSEGGKSDGGKSDGGKANGGKSDGAKSDGAKSNGAKSDGGKSDGGKSDGGKSDGGKSDGGKSDGGKSDGGKSDGGKSDGGKSDGGKSDGGKSEGGKSDGEGQGGKTADAKGGDTPGGSGTSANPTSGGGGNSAGGSSPGSDDGPALQPAEDPNLEYGKNAADLVLKRLEEDLARGNVDADLAKKLGWGKDDMQRFAERLRNHLGQSDAAPDSPQEAASQRQFEEMLRNLKFSAKNDVRKGNSERARDAEVIGSRRLRVPPEYRDALEAFQRRVAE